MKRTDLIKHLEGYGCEFLREGGSHTVYVNRKAKRVSTIPRHREIDENLCRKICMEKTKAELDFEQYREYLQREVIRLVEYLSLYRRLHERRKDRLEEMNIAPGFFWVVFEALFTAIVLWVEKLFSGNSERGLVDFLAFCERNLWIFGIKELQRRRGYQNGHWMLERTPIITMESVREDMKRVQNLPSLRSFKLRRDKFHAHFDKDYFFDSKKLAVDAPLKRSDLEEIVTVIDEILNRYSAAYDGNCSSLKTWTATDVDYLLDDLHSYRLETNRNGQGAAQPQ